MKQIKSLRRRYVALTGTSSMPRNELRQHIARRGGRVSGEDAGLTERTDLLVRGASSTWKHRLFGRKEAPPVAVFDMLDWSRFHAIVEVGYTYARERLIPFIETHRDYVARDEVFDSRRVRVA